MKGILFTILLGSGAFNFCFAQEPGWEKKKNIDSLPLRVNILKEPRFLFNLHSGYAFGLGSTFKFYPDDIGAIVVTKVGSGSPQKLVSYYNPKKGLGDGFRFGGGFTRIINDFINIGIDVDYFKSTIYKTRDSSFRQTQIPAPMGQPDEYVYKESVTISYDASLITFSPNITFKAISRPKWFLYNKLGGVITFRPNSREKDITDIVVKQGWQGFYKDSASKVIKGYDWGIRNPALGFMGAIGMQVKLEDKVRAFAELQFSHIVFVVRKRSLLEFLVDGNDMKNTVPLNQRETRFVKSFTLNFSDPNPNEPTQTLVQRIPISYIGLQVGLAFQLR